MVEYGIAGEDFHLPVAIKVRKGDGSVVVIPRAGRVCRLAFQRAVLIKHGHATIEQIAHDFRLAIAIKITTTMIPITMMPKTIRAAVAAPAAAMGTAPAPGGS